VSSAPERTASDDGGRAPRARSPSDANERDPVVSLVLWSNSIVRSTPRSAPFEERRAAMTTSAYSTFTVTPLVPTNGHARPGSNPNACMWIVAVPNSAGIVSGRTAEPLPGPLPDSGTIGMES
jgi:hypothetical protein